MGTNHFKDTAESVVPSENLAIEDGVSIEWTKAEENRARLKLVESRPFCD
jgi:hypothetical protein